MVIFGQTVVAQQEFDEKAMYDEYAYEEYDYGCGFSDNELITLSKVSTMFEQHAQTKIIDRLFVDMSMKELVAGYTEEYMLWLDAAIERCDQWYAEWYGPSPWEYADFMSDLEEYVSTLIALKSFEVNQISEDPVADSFATLRNIVLGEQFELLSQDWWTQQVWKMMFDLQVKDEYSDVDVSFDLDLDSIWKTDASAMKLQTSLGWDLRVISDDADIDTSGDISAEMILLDGHLYIKIKDFDIELGNINFDNQYDAEWFNEMLAGIQVIQGKYIDIPLMPEGVSPFGYWMNPRGDIANQQAMMIQMMSQDRLTTYGSQDNVVYGWMNPLACDAVSTMWWVSWCITMRKDMIDHTWWWWIFFMETNNGVTSMWITDKFAAEDMPDELRLIANQPLLSRNENEIVAIQIPLYDEQEQIWNISYQNNAMKITASFDEMIDYTEAWPIYGKTDVDITGTMSDNIFEISWSVRWNDTDAEFDMMVAWDQTDMDLSFTLDFSDTNEWYPVDVMMSMSLEQQTNYLDSATITKPQEWEIIDLEALQGY